MKKVMTAIPIALCLLCSCSNGRRTEQLRTVLTVEPVSVGTEEMKVFSGVVQEARTISLGFKTPGQIDSIGVKEGNYVQAGQLLARLDDSDYKLGVEAAQIQYDQLQNEVARMKTLYENKNISGNDYEKAVAGLQQLQVQLQVNRNKLDYTRLYAPADGYVQSVNFEESEMVDAGTPLIALLDMSQMEVVIDLPAALYNRRDDFVGFFCRSTVTGSENIPLALIGITPKADGTQLYKMRLLLSRKDTRLSSGMNVEVLVHIAGKGAGSVYTLPLQAVFHENADSYVWVLGADSAVHKTPVLVEGVDAAGNAVITSGLAGGESVVKAGVDALHEGEKVRVLAPSEENVGGIL